VLPGQETGNADYVVNHGAGEMARSDIEVLEVFAHWMMADGKLLKKRAAAAAALGRPRAAYDIAEMVYQSSFHNLVRHKRFFSKRSLVDLFNRNHVRWGDVRESKELK